MALLLQLSSDDALDFEEFLLGQFEVFLFKVEVTLESDRDEMDMGMRYFKTDNGHANALAGDGFLDGLGNVLCEHHHLSKFIIIDIKDIVGFVFGDHEGVTFRQGVDIEECKKLVVFGNFIAWDFALNDSGEDGGHNR